jgi:hypothetical protein
VQDIEVQDIEKQDMDFERQGKGPMSPTSRAWKAAVALAGPSREAIELVEVK